MSIEAIHTAELLSAYLCGDVAPDERVAVERLLADDVLAQEHLDELRQLSIYLKSGATQASPQALESLRRAVFQRIQEKQLKALVTVGVTGDLSDSEKNQVDAYLKNHPAEAKEQRQMAALSELCNLGKLSAGPALAEKLRAKLAAKLPQAAMAQKTAATRQTVSARPSLRVFVPRENPWKKRLLVMGGLAAAVALATGARTVWVHYFSAPTIHDQLVHGPAENPKSDSPPAPDMVIADVPPPKVDKQLVPVPSEAAVKNDVRDSVNPVQPNQDVTLPPKVVENNAPNNVAPRDTVTPLPQPDPKNDRKVAVPQPKTNDPKNVAPDNGPVVANQGGQDNDQGPRNSNPNTNPNTNPNNGTGRLIPQNNPSVAVLPTTNGVDTVAKNNGPTQPPAVAPTAPSVTPPNNGLGSTSVTTTIAPQEGAGVVGAIKSGVAQLHSGGGNGSTLKQYDVVPSGSRIDTDEKTHVALVLPGGGRLYVNSSSTLTVTFNGHNTSIDMASGEIYYKAPADGTLTLTLSKITVAQATETDVSLAGQVKAVNMGTKSMEFSNIKQKVNVFVGSQASAAPEGTDTIKKDSAPAQTGVWRGDVLLDHDVLKASGKARR